jgi:hypothetical protein
VIPDTGEIMRSLYGAYRLGRLDPDGMEQFDLTLGGFWRSFLVAVPLAPMFLVLANLYRPGDSGALVFFAVKLAGFLAGWAVFPVVMVFFTRAFGLQAGYVPFMVAYNWSHAIVMAVVLPLAAVVASRVLPNVITGMLSAGLMFITFYYLWFIARTALRTTKSLAVAVTLIEFALTFLVQMLVERAFQ